MKYQRLQRQRQVPSRNKSNVLLINYSVTRRHTCTSGQLRRDARSDSFTLHARFNRSSRVGEKLPRSASHESSLIKICYFVDTSFLVV
jgi:hypothetical protein